MAGPTTEEIKAREAIEHPYEPENPYFEAWLCEYTKDAYEDQLGFKHWAWVVHDRVIIKVYARGEQFEHYAQKWYMADWFGVSEDGRKWRSRANLVDYWGGMSWLVIEGEPAGYYRRPPWIDPARGFAPGYMLPDGTPATPLLGKEAP